jgi:hypothetical protein
MAMFIEEAGLAVREGQINGDGDPPDRLAELLSGGKPPKNVRQVAERVDAVPLATGRDAEQHRRRASAIVTTDEQPVFAAHGLRSQ